MVIRKPRGVFGSGVALYGDSLIVNGPMAQEVYSKTKAEGVAIPFVELVTTREPVLLAENLLS